tara:strand:+ start:76 stop:306 length:231 start_codon:yes stop_codon:yes gene_type:complete
MDFDSQINLEHLLFYDRKCRTCHETKNLLEDFYLIRKNRGVLPSSYSYECKTCTVKRVVNYRKEKKDLSKDVYPDW